MEIREHDAGRTPDPQHGRWRRRALFVVAWIVLTNVGGAVMLTVVEHTTKAYAIPSSAMEPTLHCARPAPGCEAGTMDRVLVLRFPSRTPKRGDIVVFKTPPAALSKCGAGGTFTKRLVGLPGETVTERNGLISIDGKPLQEPYVEHRYEGPRASWHVPAGTYFVLGDNRPQSCDSRVWGTVPRGNVVGPIVARYWPLDRIGSP